MTPRSERARQWVHVGSGSFALLLRVLTWWQAVTLAALAFAFNLLVLPHIGGRRLYRPIDEARGFALGILLYPLSVLLLILAFPSRPDIAAAAWGILALGDGSATLVGTCAGRGQLPWNREKTAAGTLAFIVCGGLGGVALALWTRPSVTPLPPLAFAIVAPLVAAVAAALVETVPVRLDDNISVPTTAAVVLWVASLMTWASVGASRETMLLALGANVVVAWLGYRARTVSLSGAIGGALIGSTIFTGAGAGAWGLLMMTFIAASVASRLGLERKTMLGIAEERGGRRGAANAVANCGVATIAAIAAATTADARAALLALVAALTAGGSDTVASEVGKAWGRSTFLVTTLGRVKPGTPGAMSAEGTAAGIVSAFALAAAAVGLGLIPGSDVAAVVIGATAGAIVASLLGATLEGPGVLNNDMLNLINTAVAAGVALAIA